LIGRWLLSETVGDVALEKTVGSKATGPTAGELRIAPATLALLLEGRAPTPRVPFEVVMVVCSVTCSDPPLWGVEHLLMFVPSFM
jgi:hypothetical protein